MKLERKRKELLGALETLVHAAERIDSQIGHDDDGSPCDWNEWVALRHALMNARHALAREGIQCEVLYSRSVETQGKRVED